MKKLMAFLFEFPRFLVCLSIELIRTLIAITVYYLICVLEDPLILAICAVLLVSCLVLN
jgi:hypothetical protein